MTFKLLRLTSTEANMSGWLEYSLVVLDPLSAQLICMSKFIRIATPMKQACGQVENEVLRLFYVSLI